MVHCSRRRTLGTLLALAILIALTALLVFVGQARAGEPAASPPPTVVRELAEERTATRQVYLLSDGTKRTHLFEVPVHYRDADGTWRAIDRRLVATGVPGVFTSAGTQAEVVVAGEGKGRLPVTISFDGATVGFDLLGSTEEEPLVLGESAYFLAACAATDLSYAVTDRGVKETITLVSKKAPDRFTFFLAHEGLVLAQDETGQWGFYRKEEPEPVFELSDLLVYDSSESAAGVADVCDEAEMTIAPAPGGSYVTYAVSRKWLEDEARVWPVMIDPTITLGQAVCTDTFVCSANPTSTYGSSADLRAGRYDASTGWNRSLIKFAVSSIDDPGVPGVPYIHAADLRMYQYSGGASPLTHVGVMEENWSDATTWNGLNDGGVVSFHNIGDPSVSANEWLEQSCKSYVQNWLDGDAAYPNYGFTVYQNANEGASYYRKFRSSNYGTSTYRPRIEVEYDDDHYAGVSDYPASATIGDTSSAVSVTMKTYTDYPADVLEMELGLNLAAGEITRYRGWLRWFKNDPGAGYVRQQLADGSYVAYQAGQYGNDRITPQFAHCSAATTSTYRRVTFAFTLNDNYGDVQDTDFDTRFGLGPGTNVTWSSGWVTHNTNFDAVPKPIPALSSTVSGNDEYFLGVGANDTVDQGRGTVNLSWGAIPGATSYHIYLFDGHDYWDVGSTSQTEWTSAGKGVFPTDSQIAALPDEYTGNPFRSGDGRDLRDSPKGLYAKTQGTTYDAYGNYWFRVAPANGSGIVPWQQNAAAVPALPGRSVSAMDEQHTITDLGSWDGHSLGCRLDEGRLTGGVTDLAISSLGPAAELTRSYLSEAATTRYAPGWFFSFDQHLDLSGVGENPNRIVYVDEAGQEHDFLRSAPGSDWKAPNGLVATLSLNVDGSWKLLFDSEQRYLTFSGSGVLLAETANDLTTTYEWSASELVIRAANGQEIEVALSSGVATGASYATTSAGTRTVAYAGSGADWSVTYNGADTGAGGTARTVAYSYANGRLTGITQEAWPAGGSSATLTVVYADGKVSEIRYPDFDAQAKPDAHALITYDLTTDPANPNATVRRFGTVGESANQPISQSVYTWTPSSEQVPNLLASVTDGFGEDETTTEYTYSDDLQIEEETIYDDEGDEIALYEADIDEDVLVGRHDVEAESIATEIDQNGEAEESQTTTYDYDDEHQVVAESTVSDAAGKRTETRYTYDDAGNAIEEWQVYFESAETETPVVAAYTLRSYSDGHLTMEKKLVSADYVEPGALEGQETPEDRTITNPVWAETTYSDFALNGEPQTTVAKGVLLAPGAAQDLTKTATYDEFGNLLAETDWGGRTEQTSAYDLAGRQLTSTGASGLVTHTAYDVLGNAAETFVTVDGSDVKANWSASTYDAMGRALTVETYLSDEGGDPTTQSEVANTYDGSGNQLTSSDSTVGGEPEKWVYDASGKVTEHWGLGVKDYLEGARSTRTAYDEQGQVTGESQPGNAAAAGAAGSDLTGYDDAGQVKSEAKADGSTTTYAYDGSGSQIETTSTASGTTTSAYGAAGRLVSTTNARGFTTTSAYDLLGRVVGAAGSGQTATETSYNALGWVLQSVDASGVTVTKTYDAHGNVVSETRGSAGTTESTYDAANRLLTRTDPNGNLRTNTYDAFGNVYREVHTDWNDAPLKDLTTDHDSLGRPTSQTEAVSGRARTWTYPQNAAGGVEETLSYGGAAEPVSFGNEVAETGIYDGMNDWQVVSQWTLGQAAAIDSVRVYLDNLNYDHPACKMKATIYADDGNNVGDLLAVSEEVSVSDGQQAGWVEFALPASVDLPAGTYWLGAIGDGDAGGIDLYCAWSGGRANRGPDTYSDGPVDPYSGGYGYTTWKFSIYATGEAAGSASTSTEIARNARGMETSRVITIASGEEVTRTIADDEDGRDTADRWTQAHVRASTSTRTQCPEGSGLASAPSMRVRTGGACGVVFVIGDFYPTEATWGSPSNGYGNEVEPAVHQSCASYTRLGMAAGPSGETTVAPSDGNETWTAHQFALKAGSAGITEVGSATATGTSDEVSVTHGLTITSGDVVLVMIHANGLGNAITDDNGAATLTEAVQEDGAETNRYAIFSRVAGSSEPTSYAFSLASSQRWSVIVRVFRGVDEGRWDVAPSLSPLLSFSRSFDNAGRVVSQSGAGFDGAGSYAYHATKGLKTSQTLPLDITAASAFDDYAYASDGRLDTWAVRPSATATPTPMATYSYDDAGNLEGDGTTTFTYSAAGQGSTPNRLLTSTTGGQVTYYGWDTANAWRTAQGPSGDPDQIQYTYVKSGAATSSGRMTGYSVASASSITEVGSASAAGSGTQVSITPGVALQEGDVVLALIHANASGNAISDDNGASAFTSDIQEDGADTSRYAIVHRIAAGSEPATYAWTLQSSQSWSVQVRVFRGVDASVWDVAPSAATRAGDVSGTVATAPSMTVASPGALGLLVCLTDTSAGTSYSSPTNGYAAALTPGATMLQSSWTKTWDSAGATGTSAATLSASNDWVAHQVALRPAGGTSASYAYDASGQRIRSTVSANSTTTTTDFTYDGLTLLRLDANDGTDSWRIDYLYDEEGTVYGGVYGSPADSTSPTCFTLITNDHGDVLELLDSDGDAFASYRYDPWGLPLASGTTTQSTNLISSNLAGDIATRQILRYASYAYDAESSLYYCSARYYDPTTRQWTTGDPAKADGEQSAYQYCKGNPAGNADPSGLISLYVPNKSQYERYHGKTMFNWCWAACMRSVIQYMKGKKPTLARICKVTLGSIKDKGATLPEMISGLKHWSIVAKLAFPISWSTLKSDLESGHPAISQIKWAGEDTRHCHVLCGADRVNQQGWRERVRYMDPASARKVFGSYQWYRGNSMWTWKWTLRCS